MLEHEPPELEIGVKFPLRPFLKFYKSLSFLFFYAKLYPSKKTVIKKCLYPWDESS